jgi:hypothetical protein
MGVRRVGELEVGQDLAFQRWEWRVQRIAWVFLLLVLVAAAGGLFGHGPIAHATVGGPDDPIRVRHDRLDRKRAATELKIEVAPGTARGGQVRVWVSRDYLDRIEIRDISPEPAESEAGANRIVYTFSVADESQPTIVSFAFEHQKVGRARGEIGLVDGASVAFSQFVYP